MSADVNQGIGPIRTFRKNIKLTQSTHKLHVLQCWFKSVIASSVTPMSGWALWLYRLSNEHALLSQEPKMGIANKEWRFTRVTFLFRWPSPISHFKIYERKGDSHMAASLWEFASHVDQIWSSKFQSNNYHHFFFTKSIKFCHKRKMVYVSSSN
jgi:hypothetical protein